MRKVYVEATVKLIVLVEEGVDIVNVLDEMDYNFECNTAGANIEDFQIEDYDIKDSK